MSETPQKRALVFATNNAHKLSEIRSIAGSDLEILSLHDIRCEEELPETSDTLTGNALQKARYVKQHYGYDCFADDTGLMVKALGGGPGVYTARYAGEHCSPEDNIVKMLGEMEGEEDREAYFATVIALVEDCGERTFEGRVDGHISKERRGEGGFGYDPIFIPLEGGGLSFAEMDGESKNRISHRGRATRAFLTEIVKREKYPK